MFSATTVDPTLDSLFTKSFNKSSSERAPIKEIRRKREGTASSASVFPPGQENQSDDDTPLSASDTSSEVLSDATDGSENGKDQHASSPESDQGDLASEPTAHGRGTKRKRGTEPDRRQLAETTRIDDKSYPKRRVRSTSGNDSGSSSHDGGLSDVSEDEETSEFEIPKHETQNESSGKAELERASRTVFLGNVSTEAIKSKDSLRTLKNHLSSFFPLVPSADLPHRIESVRFRSTAFTTTFLPRKAAFAKKDLMDATTKSTNAYAVYTTQSAAREAVKRLNATVVLGRHIRVDSVAHPSPIDHRRCVFVGNLDFVDDESLIQEAEASGEKKPRKRHHPSDAEEGLWQHFQKAGQIESVRMIRDKSTRVGKGFAYVQFRDQVAAEKALAFDGKKFPPMLPRALRVTRAKKVTKTASYQAKVSGPSRIGNEGRAFNPKPSPNANSLKGRASKMLGRAGGAQLRNASKGGKSGEYKQGSSFRGPEDFVFEGHRASINDGKLGRRRKGIGKPQSRSSRRAAVFKAAGRKK